MKLKMNLNLTRPKVSIFSLQVYVNDLNLSRDSEERELQPERAARGEALLPLGPFLFQVRKIYQCGGSETFLLQIRILLFGIQIQISFSEGDNLFNLLNLLLNFSTCEKVFFLQGSGMEPTDCQHLGQGQLYFIVYNVELEPRTDLKSVMHGIIMSKVWFRI